MSGTSTPSGVAYAVGGQPKSGFLLKREEQVWTRIASFPEMVHWVHHSQDDIWMAGANGLVAHLDETGQDLPLTEVDTNLEFWGIFAVNNENVWVVGGDPRAAESTAAIIFRFDGNTWHNIPLPALDRPCPSLFKVWARDEDEVYFVGANGILLAFDGTNLTQIPLEFGDDLVSIWGTESGQIVAVGGRTRGVIVTRRDNNWETSFIAQTSGLNGIWVTETEAIAVGHQGHIVHWYLDDPARRSFQTPTDLLLHGIFALSDSKYATVGGSLDQPQPWRPVLLETTR